MAVFSDYYMAEEERLKGYTVANVGFGINAADSGMLIELEREVDNVVLGIDILYDPDHEELEEPCQISQEYVKCVFKRYRKEQFMTDKEVCRYLELVDRRLFIIVHAGIDWIPEYGSELKAIDQELAELKVLVEQEHGRRAAVV